MRRAYTILYIAFIEYESLFHTLNNSLRCPTNSTFPVSFFIVFTISYHRTKYFLFSHSKFFSGGSARVYRGMYQDMEVKTVVICFYIICMTTHPITTVANDTVPHVFFFLYNTGGDKVLVLHGINARAGGGVLQRSHLAELVAA